MNNEKTTLSNWRSRLIEQGHLPEIQLAEEIYNTPGSTKDLDLGPTGCETTTEAWVLTALNFLHAEQNAINAVIGIYPYTEVTFDLDGQLIFYTNTYPGRKTQDAYQPQPDIK